MSAFQSLGSAVLLPIIAAAYAVSSVSVTHAFQPTVLDLARTRYGHHARVDFFSSVSSSALTLSSDDTDFQSLMVMDVVLFQRRPNISNNTPITKLEIGAVQENGNVAPLSTWTLESAYTSATNDMIEFVVDEEDLFPGLSCDQVQVVKILDGIDYGSRQVGGGKGPGNPHGEESEMLYYVDRGVVEGMHAGDGDGVDVGLTIDVVVNPNLEILF